MNSNPDHVIFYGFLLYQPHLFQDCRFQGHDSLASQDFHSMLTIISNAATCHCLYQNLLLMAFIKTRSQFYYFSFYVLKVLLVFQTSSLIKQVGHICLDCFDIHYYFLKHNTLAKVFAIVCLFDLDWPYLAYHTSYKSCKTGLGSVSCPQQLR